MEWMTGKETLTEILGRIVILVANMKVDTLLIQDFRGVKRLSINFDPKVTLLVGRNGAGKSTVLDAVALVLSWLVARIMQQNGKGNLIANTDIRNGAIMAVITVYCREEEIDGLPAFTWELLKVRKGQHSSLNSRLVQINELANAYHALLQDSVNPRLPIIVYYPVSRNVNDIPLRIRKEGNLSPTDAYDSSLKGSANFRFFFEWFRNREDLENETRLSGNQLEHRDSQLQAVRKAIEAFVPEFTSLTVKRNPLRMEVQKGNEKLQVDQLSMGEKCLLAMVGDLARRLAIANPSLSNPLQGTGVVLIDEIDLHLHPQWQRSSIKNLTRVFPNCQFIVSTHSPQIIGEVDPSCLRVLSKNDAGEITLSTPEVSLGLDSAEVLDVIMDTPVRNEEVDAKLMEIFGYIDAERFEEAKKQISRLKETLHGSIPEIVRAETMIAVLEP